MNINLPSVTIGIPTYNRLAELTKALQDLTAQDYPNLKIIVSDNCSEQKDEYAALMQIYTDRDSRISYIRQNENIGALRNLHFLLTRSDSDYFIWAADDDEFSPNMISTLVTLLQKNPKCVVAVPGWDLLNLTTNPHILKNFTKYMYDLAAETPAKRLYRFISQPEYYGRSRILWGLFRREVLTQAFNEVLEQIGRKTDLNWSEMPIEFQALVHGNLAVSDATLMHCKMLASSDGIREGALFYKREVEMCNRSFRAYRKVISNAPLSYTSKLALTALIYFQNTEALIRVVPFYFIQRHAPGLANKIKVIWFKYLVSNK